ncbi:proteinase inhibitor, propeptide [Gigaspora margarita]|uniref:Proteinase inhibitor, propeptide n=1 Tax=Gigaspora margarita TaxID=4874 RepID=A0A8H4B191_GIGMA|nr:proteinase inhibitor, propeptide [Gigaspora margarita]
MGELNKIMTFKNDTPNDVIAKVKKQIEESGGKITSETSTVAKMIMYTIPEGIITVFSEDDNQHILADENDGVVTTQ